MNKSYVITDRHPNPLFSVCIISPNAERKIMQTNCVRKTGAVFFCVAGKLSGVISNVLNRQAALLKHTALLNLKQAALLEIMLRVLLLIMQHALHIYIHFPHIFFTD